MHAAQNVAATALEPNDRFAHSILRVSAHAASVFAALNKFYIVWRREDFDRHAASGSINAERSWQACVGFNFSRALLNAVHVCVMLTACWFIVLLCAAVTCVTLFYFVDEATSRAIGDIVTAEEVRPLSCVPLSPLNWLPGRRESAPPAMHELANTPLASPPLLPTVNRRSVAT